MSRPRLTWQSTGAQVLTAEVGGWPLLYCSPLHDPSTGRPARGGVPVLFPQFADRGPLKKHGWARDVDWSLVEENIGDDFHSVHLKLEIGTKTIPEWHYSVTLDMKAIVTNHTVTLSLEVTNTGTDSFDWSGGLHPYWAVDDVSACAVTGLHGKSAKDRYDHRKRVEEQEVLHFNGNPFECLYESTQGVTLETRDYTLFLSSTGFERWMIWNPGESESRNLQDLPESDWKRFLCIEPLVLNGLIMKPQESFRGILVAKITASKHKV